jgi:hypothetical protein
MNRELIRRVREVARSSLPQGSVVLVVSRGDDELLKLNGVEARHFPQTEEGVYAGHHPADSGKAVQHLQALQRKGAGFLLLPSTAFWWLDFYNDFQRYLDSCCRKIAADQSCIIYQLEGGALDGRLEIG